MGTIADKLQGIVDSKADIADAIEEKGGTVPTKLADYGDAIRNLPSGPEKDSYPVEFIDYDGTLLYGFEAEEVEEWTSDADLPELPEREGFINQGWNYTAAQVKSTLAAIGGVTVGCHYITDDDKTRIKLVIDSPDYVDVTLKNIAMNVNGSQFKIDWGDGNYETKSGNKDVSFTVSHTYSPSSYPARYTIEIESLAGSYRFKNNLFFGSDSINQGGNTNAYAIMNSMVEEFEFGSSPTGLGQSFAKYNARLKAVSLPKDIRLWGNSFSECVSLTGFVFPHDIPFQANQTSQGQVAAITLNCRSLKRVSIPYTINTNGGSYFSGCSALKKVNFPQAASSFNNWMNMFYNCHEIHEINMPAVDTMGTGVFQSCQSLETLRIGGIDMLPNCALPAVVTTMNKNCFRDIKTIRSFVFPRVATIPEDALNSCYCLNKVVVPNSVTSIGTSAFSNCMGVTVFDFTAFDAYTGKQFSATNDLDIQFQDGTTHIYVSNGELITETQGDTYYSSPSLVFKQSDWADYWIPPDFVPQGDPHQDSSPTNIYETWCVYNHGGTWYLMSQGTAELFPVSNFTSWSAIGINISGGVGTSTVDTYTGSFSMVTDVFNVPSLGGTNVFNVTSPNKKIVVRDSAYDAFRTSSIWSDSSIQPYITKESEA